MNFVRGQISLLVLLLILINSSVVSQQHSLPADHPVYNYLFLKSSQGLLPEYSSQILPKTTGQILEYLDSLNVREIRYTGIVNELTSDFRKFIQSYSGAHVSFKEGDEWNFTSYSSIHDASALYSYNDSLVRFETDLAGDFSLALKRKNDGGTVNAFMMGYGAKFRFHFGDWLAASMMLQNGNSYGSREAALSEARIRNSHTFSSTGRNNFDFTRGYLRIASEHLSLSVGREKILIGASVINRAISGEERPDFDFIRFETQYKDITYSFLHAWLVTGLTEISFAGKTVEKFKPNKYFAMNRLGWRVNENFSFGLTQMMFYAYRSPELAYLTPFLFWESAQRSMNDPDNGLLGIDFTLTPVKGIRLTAEILADDINFDSFGSEGFNSIQNTTFYRGALFFPELIPLKNALAGFEVTAVRPYTFSHPGYGDALNFSNDGVLMGDNIQPNSIGYSFFLSWQPEYSYSFLLKADYIMHGRNTYNSDGTLRFNYGGDFRESYNYFTPRLHKLLAGDRMKTSLLTGEFSYRFSYHILLTTKVQIEQVEFQGNRTSTAAGLFSFIYTPFGERY
ncbi:MAG: hypothetical protein IT279_01360 [Ignavibacteriaceae bacterium]|nr:hypothetical protein [Ignavibacteriaceae bacterium]